MKQCTKSPSNIQHASIKARVYVRAKAKGIKYRGVDRTVWNHNTMPLHVTLDPLECKNIIRHLNGTYIKIIKNLHYNKTVTLLEDHYFQERLEQFQTFLQYIN